MNAVDIPVAHTPPGFWSAMPPPLLGDCTEPLHRDAPDLHGLWRAQRVEMNGEPVAAGAPQLDHVERIEQCGDRVVVTSGGVIHDMRADGTLEHGVDDISAINGERIRVSASFEQAGWYYVPTASRSKSCASARAICSSGSSAR